VLARIEGRVPAVPSACSSYAPDAVAGAVKCFQVNHLRSSCSAFRSYGLVCQVKTTFLDLSAKTKILRTVGGRDDLYGHFRSPVGALTAVLLVVFLPTAAGACSWSEPQSFTGCISVAPAGAVGSCSIETRESLSTGRAATYTC
jgi:hypothetical protein